MTKSDIIKALEPFSGDVEILMVFPGNDDIPISIKHADYFLRDGEGMIVLVPMGSHFNKSSAVELGRA